MCHWVDGGAARWPCQTQHLPAQWPRQRSASHRQQSPCCFLFPSFKIKSINTQLQYKWCVTSQAMFTSSRQDLGFQRSSGTKTWRRLVEAVDLRYVQHTHSSVCTVGQVWSDETTLFLKSQINKNGGMEYLVCKVPTINTGINSRNRETKTRYKVMYSSLYNTGLQNEMKV